MQKKLPKVTKTPFECIDKFQFVLKSLESQSLSLEQILDVVKLDSAANLMEIITDDFATYANQEATLKLKVTSNTS